MVRLKIPIGSFDIVGDIAVFRVPDNLTSKKRDFAKAIMASNRHVKTVLLQTGPVAGVHRLRRLKWVLGEKKTVTMHREYGCMFKVDLAKAYFSPRLSFERMRIASLVKPMEVVVNMFAGVGCFSIIVAKHSQASKIYSVDLNPNALAYMAENIRMNRVEKRVTAVFGEAKSTLGSLRFKGAGRVLMPLPEVAYQYLEVAAQLLGEEGGAIHYYDFVHARKDENPVSKIAAKVSGKLGEIGVSFEIGFGRIVRSIGPNWYQVAADILLK